ncbi:unnamed protein product [Kluyveromyces dobzhanskii CBS 2104]|uniref:protein-tyrosine-phosphatase n=1 Tax=Kluyveromyces dobzhanskii CBS 2104 TaxID=1427455 RepID=A0A0A8L2E9_9SACH|nr:unnamed protein product [Kluyveromyces dobzhanskii CBS 2104]
MQFVDAKSPDERRKEMHQNEHFPFSMASVKPPTFAGSNGCKDGKCSQSSQFTSENSSILSSSSTLVDDKSIQALSAPADLGLDVNDKKPALGVRSEHVLIHASTFPSTSDPSSISSCHTHNTGMPPSPLSTSHKSSVSFTMGRSRSIAMKTNSLPIIPTIRPKDLRFPKHNDCSFITAHELHQRVETMGLDPKSKLIIFDARPFIDFNKSHIASSIHLSLPSTLLKRKNFNLERLIDNLASPTKEILSEYLLGTNCNQVNTTVVIYDNISNQTDSAVSLACFGISSKILDHVSEQRTPSVCILSEGFDSFSTSYPNNVEVGAVDMPNAYPVELLTSPPQIDDVSPVPLHLKPIGGSYSHLWSPIKQPPQVGNSRTISGSPVSTSSPLSSLFGFKLPAPINNEHSSTFKLPQIEQDITDLDNYVQAVEINERSQRTSFLASENPLKSFKFPASASSETSESSPHCFSSAQSTLTPANSIDNFDNTKLTFQVKYDNLYNRFPTDKINQIIPAWFCQLMDIPKLKFISKFQKLELLERKRLRRVLSFSSSASIAPVQPSAAGVNTSNSSSYADHDEDDFEESLQSITISSGVEFGTKNRYKDIFPYEHTRVRLSHSSICSGFDSHSYSPPKGSAIGYSCDTLPDVVQEEEDVWSTYINANYLVNPFDQVQQNSTSKMKPVRYIATQAPLKETISDFYTCILNNNSPLIITLTDEFENGVEKCCNYWANSSYEGIEVNLLDEYSFSSQNKPVAEPSLDHEDDKFASKFFRHLNLNKTANSNNDIIIRRIELVYNNGKSRFQLLQIQIKGWPDLGTLLSPNEILQIINLKNFIIDTLFAKNVYPSDYIPTIVVHCSAGCGRTGTLCTIDSVLSNLGKFGSQENSTQSGDFSLSLTEELAPTANHNPSPATKCQSKPMFDPIVTTVNQFRRQRISMVQNINQFLFIYDCLLFYFTLNLEPSSTGVEKRNRWQTMTEQNSELNILHDFITAKVDESHRL